MKGKSGVEQVPAGENRDFTLDSEIDFGSSSIRSLPGTVQVLVWLSGQAGNLFTNMIKMSVIRSKFKPELHYYQSTQ